MLFAEIEAAEQLGSSYEHLKFSRSRGVCIQMPIWNALEVREYCSTDHGLTLESFRYSHFTIKTTKKSKCSDLMMSNMLDPENSVHFRPF